MSTNTATRTSSSARRSAGNKSYSNGTARPRRRRSTPYVRFRKWLRKNALAVFIAVVLGTGIAAGSAGTAAILGYKYSHSFHDYGRELRYASYTVKSGDTMWSIAVDMAALNPEFQDVRQYLALLQKTNHNYGDYLQSGTVIMVPYYDGGDTAPMFDAYLKYNIAGYEEWLEMLSEYGK